MLTSIGSSSWVSTSVAADIAVSSLSVFRDAQMLFLTRTCGCVAAIRATEISVRPGWLLAVLNRLESHTCDQDAFMFANREKRLRQKLPQILRCRVCFRDFVESS